MHLARRQVRLLGALASSVMAAIYFLIGLRILDIGGSTSGETVDLAMIGFSAGLAFLVLSGLLVYTDRRWLWILAAASLVWVNVIYISTSGGREPPFEIWGITLWIIQLPLLAVLIYLSWGAQRSTTRGVGRQVRPRSSSRSLKPRWSARLIRPAPRHDTPTGRPDPFGSVEGGKPCHQAIRSTH